MTAVESHKTALRRYELSRPLKIALRDNIIERSDEVLDYGCGHGSDIQLLQRLGYKCTGWDPVHRPKTELSSAEIVNLGFIINVIPDISDRTKALKRAFSFAKGVLIVSAQLDIYQNKSVSMRPFGDGYLTTRNTFQRLYSQEDLRSYLTDALGIAPVPAAPGIFYVFRDQARQEALFQSRSRTHLSLPRLPKPTLEERHANDRPLLEAFLKTICELGRLPTEEEFSEAPELRRRLGSLKKAFRLVQDLFPNHEIDTYRRQRLDDLTVYLALAQFRPQPPFSTLPVSLQNDMRFFFGSYLRARDAGKQLLFQVSSPEQITAACLEAKMGKLLPDDLYIHVSSKDRLPPLLRVYIGCAQAMVGTVEGANIIKIHMRSGKLSYLEYPDFDRSGHPGLRASTTVLLREQKIRFRDYSSSDSPPVLHRKETLVSQDYPKYKLFAALTRFEQEAGLLDDAATIGFRQGWELRLSERGYTVKGHRLLQRSTAPTRLPQMHRKNRNVL